MSTQGIHIHIVFDDRTSCYLIIGLSIIILALLVYTLSFHYRHRTPINPSSNTPGPRKSAQNTKGKQSNDEKDVKMVTIAQERLTTLEELVLTWQDCAERLVALHEEEEAMAPLAKALRMFAKEEIAEFSTLIPSNGLNEAFDALEKLSLKDIVREVILRREFFDDIPCVGGSEEELV